MPRHFHFAVMAVCCSMGQLAAAELPTAMRTNIDRAVENYNEALKQADKKLLESFDRQIALVPRLPRLKASEKQSLINSLKVEKADFEKHGTFPFSPAMRKGAIEYLNRISTAKARAEMAYERGINHLQKVAKDDAAASDLTDEMKVFLAPKALGTWTFRFSTFVNVLPMTSDGYAGPKRTWVLSEKGIVVRSIDSNAPKGIWVDRGEFDSTGKKCQTKNDDNGVINNGVLANTVKE